MKQLNKILSAIFLVFIIHIAPSCKKNDPVPVDVASTLPGKTWRVTAITVNPAENGVTDIFSTGLPCDKDNTYKFNAGNAFVLDEGAEKCDPSYPQTITGTWSYKSNTKILNITTEYMGSTSNIDYILKDINETSFSCYIGYDVGSGTHIVTYTYTKQ